MTRKTLLFLAGLLVATASAPAQSSVWKVTKGDKVLYLGGTCHILRATDFPLPPEFDQAYAASARIIFETDIGRMQSADVQQMMLAQAMFSDGTTLQKTLTPEAWKAVQAYAAKAGMPAEQFNQFKPWFLTVMIEVMELQKLKISEEGVDLHYFKKATAAKKPLGELESVEAQLGFMTRMGAGHESELVTSSLKGLDKVPAMMTDMLAAWKRGDLAKLDELINRELRDQDPAIYKELIVQRNQAWLPKIQAMLDSPEIEFIMVGAGHICGQEGLLAQLQKAGCKTEQIKAPAPAPAK